MCEGEPRVAVVKKECSDKEFECETNICIPKKLMCDGSKHCFDGRDEDVAMCKSKNVRKTMFNSCAF
jgi:hypothetical protein